MTVAELIAVLQTLPPDLPVVQDNDGRVFVVTGAEPYKVDQPYPEHFYEYNSIGDNLVTVAMIKTD